MAVDWTRPPADFCFILFDRVDTDQTTQRFYRIGWQPTLVDQGAVVRLYGEKGGDSTLLTTPFTSLDEAWPLIRTMIRRRLQRGYRIVEPTTYRNGSSGRA